MSALLKKKHAVIAIHSLSDTSKMPGKSWGIDAKRCITGQKLATIDGTICSDCYADKGFYTMYPSVKRAQESRLEKYYEDREVWRIAMASMLVGEEWFRWFDSGDLQSAQMLRDIVWVVESTPWCRHWLATREVLFVKEFLNNGGVIPPNLVVRISAMKYNQKIDNRLTPWSSTVHTHDADSIEGHLCPAPNQGGSCGQCRACWDTKVATVSYKKH